MKTVKLWLKFEDTKEPQDLQATFSDEELDLLREFLAHVSTLETTKVITENFPHPIKLEWNISTSANVETSEFDSEYINSFLHKLRPLILFRERTSFDKITQLIKEKFDNPGMDRQIELYRRDYVTSTFSRYGQITIADVPVFDDKTLRLWLNAYEYHVDEDKRKILKYIENSFSTEGARNLFVWQLRDKASAIFPFSKLVQEIVEG